MGSGVSKVESQKLKVESSIYTPHFQLLTFHFPLSTPHSLLTFAPGVKDLWSSYFYAFSIENRHAHEAPVNHRDIRRR